MEPLSLNVNIILNEGYTREIPTVIDEDGKFRSGISIHDMYKVATIVNKRKNPRKYLESLIKETEKLINNNWFAVDKIAKSLIKYGELSSEQVDAILKNV